MTIVNILPSINLPKIKNILNSGLYISEIDLKNTQSEKFNIHDIKNFLNKYYLNHEGYIYQHTSFTLYKLLRNISQFCIHDDSNILGFISRIHIPLQIYKKKYYAVEIGHLAIKPIYRKQQFAHFLINQITESELKLGKNQIAIFIAPVELAYKHTSDILCQSSIYLRYFKKENFTKSKLLKNRLLHLDTSDLNEKHLQYSFRLLQDTELKDYYEHFMKYNRTTYDIYYDYDYEKFQDFFCNHRKIRTYCIYKAQPQLI